MSSNFVVYRNYIVRPFTIDEKETKVKEDGYSISIEEGGIPSFNIHILAIGFEYLKAKRINFIPISKDEDRIYMGGNFTSPIRRVDSFYNQIILLITLEVYLEEIMNSLY